MSDIRLCSDDNNIKLQLFENKITLKTQPNTFTIKTTARGPKGEDGSGSSVMIYDSVDELPETATNGDLAYIRGDTTETQEKSDTVFELDTIYPQIFINPTPQNLNDVAPDWEYTLEGCGYIAGSDKFLIMQQMAQGIGQDATPDILFITIGENQENPDYTYVYLFEDWAEAELVAGWYRLQGESAVSIDYEDIAEILNVELMSFDTPDVFEELKWLLPYYISGYAWATTTSASLYIYDNGWQQISSGSGGGFTTVVDCYDDLPTGSDGDIAIVRKDTLAPRTWTTMAKNTLYSRLYVNPLPYLWGEDYEDYIGLSLDAGGTQMYAAVEPSETEGFILCTLQLKGILLSAATVMAVQQNYINTPLEVSFDGRTYLEVEGGWLNTLAYADNATNEVIDVTMTPTNVGNIKSFADTYLLTANNTADEWLRVKYLIQPTPFTVNYSGVYEKINSVWTLVMRNDKLVNGNTTAPE